jgi:threonine/homoserine/homoserine lactone efflux protein
VSFGFASIVALCTTGVGALILASPMLATVIHVVGVLYLLWLAYRIARSTSLAEECAQADERLAIGGTAVRQHQGMDAGAGGGRVVHGGRPSPGQRVVLVSAIFALFGFFSNGAYGVLGASLRRWLMEGNRVRWFNGAMGLALALTAVWIAVAGQPH